MYELTSKEIRDSNEILQGSSHASSSMLYTVREISELLKTNVDYVHKLRRAGLLPFLKIGQYKVRKESLELFLKKHEGKDLTDPFHVKELN